MTILTMILTLLVALEFLYIMYLETVATSSKTTGRVFNMEKKELERKSVQTLFKNQGVYNGLIAIGLFYGLFFASASLEIVRLLLIYIILVAIYGSLTSNKKIILTQGGLAILALISSFF
ncbi:DUF1304 domain-containing protein [Lactococcus cremoris]|uniref:DUF1304 domain-containing protein n=2 Tax=Lactococcus lactis subsp. cremoris TaxID=1359 RepID=A0A1V0NTV0_LACLC|nr:MULTISPECIES: DUF1304 domain-containing protein [Lactococcus]EQC82281.1 membrane protein [Lactococcus cremoris subsp. cremoris TIFN7]EQC84479.1 membrane protein [Lactococcus cremoris subsp. cremoris TIFN1]EQC94696.1 membrane protein [Lactococcus cremoris subsp. cremoris TIFN3]ARD91641.1 DUF1304 domain-containing protein [Lactococcus cremoris]ARE17877.1 DUF1304 domain-containing protein [Lactococcus cremoris]